MPVRYVWKPGSRVHVDAQKAGAELERIRRANGGLTPEAVLDSARSHNAVLHGAFEWDDAKAAEAHRLDQAGHVIRSITVDVSRSNVEPPKTIRAFISVEQRGERHYQSLDVVMSDAELRHQAIVRAWAELVAWRQRHAELVEFAKVFAVIEEAQPARNG